MATTINQDLLNKLTIGIIIGIIVIGTLIGLRVTGIMGGDDSEISVQGSPSSGDLSGSDSVSPTVSRRPSSGTVSEESDEKTIICNWEYQNQQFTYSHDVRNTTYLGFKRKNVGVSPDLTNKEIITRHVVTDGDEGLILEIADYILIQSEQNGWGDYDTIMNTVAFVQQYGPGKFENTPPNGYYKYPVETLWDEEGSREDINILTASILQAMGYPVVFLVFPEQYDRGYLIWEYSAIGVRCEDTVPGKSYMSQQEKMIGTVTLYPQSRTINSPEIMSFEPKSGCISGNSTVGYADGQVVAAGEGVWDIAAGKITWSSGFVSPAGMTPVYYRMENGSWITGESFIYVDALNSDAQPGEIPGELARAEPEIVADLIDPRNDIMISRDNIIDSSLTPLLRTPSPLKNNIRPELFDSISDQLGIPVPVGLVSEEDEINKVSEDEYWQDIWYDTMVNFYDHTWYLDILEYEIIENQALYTKSNEMYISPAAAWRIKYEAVPVDPPDNDLEGLSSFSDMRFAVYKVDEIEGSTTLLGTFAYGHTSGQENVNYQNFYESGNFYIVTFVRNCEAKVSIQMHGKEKI
ncbi:hypothetical protein [Methanogenium sp. MK-MG]|uniref:hypothetical protein n=1 Tax=Methanogenium sp. MK-MG TaxID=2599926 RepID=UPI0013EBA79A|nr:hypothetical protein [Methanogenium sp. MK-MG]KAF1076433.1 hypothetical protein MKMG_01479 [Methanogenium sp. MK-MG]